MLNGDGLTRLFEELRPALSRFLQSRGASPEESEDILQDVHIKLLGERSGPIAQPRAYLYKMTNNHFLLHRRTVGRRERREEDWVSANHGAGEVDDNPSVEAALIAREQLAILQRVLDGLPDRTGTIFHRFRVDGALQREIAEELGISVSAVEKHLARAYEAIESVKLRLADEEQPDGRSLKGGRGRHAI